MNKCRAKRVDEKLLKTFTKEQLIDWHKINIKLFESQKKEIEKLLDEHKKGLKELLEVQE